MATVSPWQICLLVASVCFVLFLIASTGAVCTLPASRPLHASGAMNNGHQVACKTVKTKEQAMALCGKDCLMAFTRNNGRQWNVCSLRKAGKQFQTFTPDCPTCPQAPTCPKMPETLDEAQQLVYKLRDRDRCRECKASPGVKKLLKSMGNGDFSMLETVETVITPDDWSFNNGFVRITDQSNNTLFVNMRIPKGTTTTPPTLIVAETPVSWFEWETINTNGKEEWTLKRPFRRSAMGWYSIYAKLVDTSQSLTLVMYNAKTDQFGSISKDILPLWQTLLLDVISSTEARVFDLENAKPVTVPLDKVCGDCV